MFIKGKSDKYSVKEMCKLLEVPRSTYYYSIKEKAGKEEKNNELDQRVEEIFKANHGIYGARKINHRIKEMYPELRSSRYKVTNSMKKQGFVSKYCKTKAFKPYKVNTNKEDIPNILEQNFDNYKENEVVVSDLTYIKCNSKFLYICFLTDLYNREIVGYSVTEKHNTDCVIEAFVNSTIDSNKLKIFHTDRGGEFNGKELIKLLKDKNIKRSMSKPGCPYDNAVSERMFATFKREWKAEQYENIIELEADVREFVNWYNNYRIHETMGCKTPIEVKNISNMKSV
jgi:transposase InsO family protein